MHPHSLLLALLAGCPALLEKPDTAVPPNTDADADGWTVGRGDCDDGDPEVSPAAEEVPADGVDQDCDGADACYQNLDGDRYGTDALVESPDLDCSDPGESWYATDCDDTDPTISPSAEEVAADGVDQDCDGRDVCYRDADGDGYGTTELVFDPDFDCTSRTDEAPVSGDCADHDPTVHPWAGCASIGEEAGGVAIAGDEASGQLGTTVAAAGDVDGDGRPDVLVATAGVMSPLSEVGLFLGPGAGPAAFGDADLLIRGEEEGDSFGWTISGAGDLDGDGIGDVAIGAPTSGLGGAADAGAVFVFSGSHRGTLDAQPADLILLGRDHEGNLGWSLAAGQDLSGDDLPDILVGAPGAAERDGEVYLLAGGTPLGGGVVEPHARRFGDETAAGTAVAMPGDLDGDGIGDMAIGEPGWDYEGEKWSYMDMGRVSLEYGPIWGDNSIRAAADRVLTSRYPTSSGFGRLLAPAGDHDGDGLAEVLATDLNDVAVIGSAVYIMSLPGTVTSIAGGDVTGDGHPDIVIGMADASAQASRGGGVLVYEGPLESGGHEWPGLQGWNGTVTSGRAGTSVALPGDLLGDAAGDLLVGAPGEGPDGAGIAWILPGGAWF